jgi:tRNA-specific 2-thiouridylase
VSRNGRVLVAMSGGVDSSVAAALLHGGGYEVVGLTMKTWDHATTGGKAEARARGASGAPKQVGCCTLEAMNDARAVAVRLGFPHFVVDHRDEFGDAVVEHFTAEYLAGRTPNPCVLCNTHIKWDALLRRADALGCEGIATGHYARVARDEGTGRRFVRRGADRNKDQSYALWGVAQPALARTILPIGERTKPEIRALAAELGLAHVAQKPDSYEICFIPDDDYRGFLRTRAPERTAALAGGPLVYAPTGEVVGRHAGYPFYTVGQRRGLPVALGAPVYVVRIDAETNTVVVGPRALLDGRALTARGVVFGKADGLDDERPVTAQVRYRDPGAPALARAADDGLEVVFETPRPALTPGQAVVLYDGDDVLAGGWIHAATPAEPAAAGDGAFLPLPQLP